MDMEYSKMTSQVVDELKGIFGERNVLTEAEKIESYAGDEAGKEYAHMPEVVVKAENAEQIAALMKLANRQRIPVTPRGAGSGLAGSAVPVHGGIVLSLEKMNHILKIDEENMVAVCEPGVVTNDLCKAVAAKGLFYAGYPMSVEESYIGSNAATNAGGAKVVKYGSTRSHILGLECISPTGEKLVLGGKRRKETSGYNLLQLMIGSEGTLGIITKVVINLMTPHSRTVDLLAPFANFDQTAKASSAIIRTAGVAPVTMEFMDIFSVRSTVQHLNLPPLPLQDKAEAYLLFTLEGKTDDELDDLAEKAGTACMEMGALDVFIASTRTQSEKLWNVRQNLASVFIEMYPHMFTGDVVVPRSQTAEFIARTQEIVGKWPDLKLALYGHIGDGNIHPTLIDTKERTDEEFIAYVEQAYSELCLLGSHLGGTVSGEHGIGLGKKAVLRESLGAYPITLMRGIKKVFDPNNILNPGKIFDME